MVGIKNSLLKVIIVSQNTLSMNTFTSIPQYVVLYIENFHVKEICILQFRLVIGVKKNKKYSAANLLLNILRLIDENLKVDLDCYRKKDCLKNYFTKPALYHLVTTALGLSDQPEIFLLTAVTEYWLVVGTTYASSYIHFCHFLKALAR